ncbi:MAG: hypothetical protein FWH01_10675 [Oscillospiraceae bacterium]|nr:hypothetical protein [Oscillospiraceae bacterium]
MTHKERFLAAARFERPDMPALEYYYTDVGYAEHGAKLQELYMRYPGDAAPAPAYNFTSRGPDPADFDEDGNYRRLETDKWGVTWEYRIFGRIGHAIGFPLDDIGKLDSYALPPMPLSDPAAFDALKRRAESEDSSYPISHGIPGLLDQMIALRPFEKVLMDLANGEPALARLADVLTDAYLGEVRRALSAGVDIIRMGDDYGTNRAMLISPDLWRAFFFPRLKKIFDPIKAAGKLCCFHSCGQVWDILPDLKLAGADTIWPQLPLYDYGALSERLRGLGLALCMHIDRGELMQHGSPGEVKAETARLFQAFRPDNGGSWFYFEVDQGFPFENIQALAEAIAEYRC